MLGNDRVTFAVGRANPVYVNGAADTALNIGATQNLADGTSRGFPPTLIG